MTASLVLGLKDSLGARQYYRDIGNKSILLYQHVTSDSICFFTKAILCGVSEGIQMLDGAVNEFGGARSSINVCDNAGKSNFIYGIASLLNIDIWPRLNSRQNLKIWDVSKNNNYTHIGPAIAGAIRWDHIHSGWADMMWILSSIMEGVASPSLIADHLRKRPHHPANKGFSELGKMFRTIYMLKYGMDTDLRKTVMRYTARRETWNQFTRNIFSGLGGLLREKDQEDQEESFWFLNVIQNAIVLWNAHALDQAIYKANQKDMGISDQDLKHILPTMVEHVNFVGKFTVDVEKQLPFKIA